MFDTSIVRVRAADPSRRLSLLTVSIAIHSAAVVAAVSAGIASVNFPVTAPEQTEIFTPVIMPSPPPLPLGRPAPARPDPAPAKPAPQQTQAPVAPQVIPEAVPDSGAPVSSPAQSTATTTGEYDGPNGDPNGKPGGIDIGQQAGGTGTGTAVPDIIYQPGRDVISARVLRRVEPRYPPAMIGVRIPSIVVIVRCIIDKNGRIRDPEIIKGSYPPFNAAVLDAIKQWTFAPGSMQGQAVDTWFELTVKFDVR